MILNQCWTFGILKDCLFRREWPFPTVGPKSGSQLWWKPLKACRDSSACTFCLTRGASGIQTHATVSTFVWARWFKLSPSHWEPSPQPITYQQFWALAAAFYNRQIWMHGHFLDLRHTQTGSSLLGQVYFNYKPIHVLWAIKLLQSKQKAYFKGTKTL